MHTYRVAERFKSIQGEGVYAGTPMAFIRFVGCSVGKQVCHHCDTDFNVEMPWRGGGTYTAQELLRWTDPYEHVCFTGGEPLNQDLRPIIAAWQDDHYGPVKKMFHVETSGTTYPDWLNSISVTNLQGEKVFWFCVSPKPGYLSGMLNVADEIKVIVPGLGNGNGWPTIEETLLWARNGKTVFLQPRNSKFDVDKNNLVLVQDIIREHPELRLSVQLHKILRVQ